MKNKLFKLGIIFIFLMGCEKFKTENLTHNDAVGEAFTNTAKAYFRAGVSSAMKAHQVWLHDQLIRGIVPAPTGMEMEEWKVRSLQVWMEGNTNERYLVLPK